MLLRIYGFGTLAALVGFTLGIFGIGRIRVAVMGLTGTMVLLWLVAAAGE